MLDSWFPGQVTMAVLVQMARSLASRTEHRNTQKYQDRIVLFNSFLCLSRIVEEVLVSLSQGRVGRPEAENNGKVSNNNDRI
jgi:hypothetical protein